MSTVTIRLSDDTPSHLRIEGVVVQFYSLTGTLITQGTSDVDGEVTVSLPDDSYNVLFYKAGVSILPKQPQRIVVSPTLTNVFLVTGHVWERPESPDPLKCRISGTFLDPSGNPTRSIQLSFQPIPDMLVGTGSLVAPNSQITVQPDETGYCQFDLLRGVDYQAYFSLTQSIMGQDPLELTIKVPDLPSLPIESLLFPLAVLLSFSETSISLPVGSGEDSSILGTTSYSDGSERIVPPTWCAVQLTNSDPEVVDAQLLEGKMILKPLKVGTAVISAIRIVSSALQWIQPEPEFSSDSLTVTVT